MRPGYLGDLSDVWFGDFAGRNRGRKSNRRPAPATRETRGQPGFAKGKRGRPGPKAAHRGSRNQARRGARRSSTGGAGGSQFLSMPGSPHRTCGSHPLVTSSPRKAELLTLCSQCIGPHNPGGSVYNIVRGRDNLPEVVCMVSKGSYHQPTRLRLTPSAGATEARRAKAAAGCTTFTGPWRFGMGACKQCIAKGGTPTPYGTPATPTHAGSTLVYCDIPGQGRQVISSGGIIQRGGLPSVGQSLR